MMNNLYVKSIAQSPLCPQCTQEIEDISHKSRHCTFAQQVWFSLGFHWPSNTFTMDYNEWFEMCSNHLSTGKFKEMAITVVSMLSSISSNLSHPNVRSAVHWSLAPEPFVKVNVDASFTSTLSTSWSGIIIRDLEGQILGSPYRLNDSVGSTSEAEALCNTLKWA
ncbi:hypothetical protein V6N13_074437 [Hibiscus sabdariffa]